MVETAYNGTGWNDKRWARGKWPAKVYKKRRGKSWATNKLMDLLEYIDLLDEVLDEDWEED
uniref:Uncharacterized protein n=1 Tax=Romanomermis culicivorax TaxID=13658 RepID=A0A915JBL8_ROMCU